MTETSVKPVSVSSPVNVRLILLEHIFSAILWYTLELALIYFITTLLIFSQLYASVWSIQTVGLLAIIHMIAIPTAHFGIARNNKLLLLLSLLLCAIWAILIVVYVVVFIANPFDGNDFKYRPLHHIILFVYSLLDVAIVVMLSMYLINDQNDEHNKTEPAPAPAPTPPTTSAIPLKIAEKSEKSLPKK